MVCKWMKILLLAGVLTGLCARAQANTTAAASPGSAARVALLTAQNDITITPESLAIPVPAAGAEAPPVPPGQAMVRIALLLPLRSDALRPAAEMVRAGFMAAHEREQDRSLAINVVQTGDSAADILSGYQDATRDNDIVVGPLSRSGVAALAQAGSISKPTIALTQAQADSQGDSEPALPDKMLAIGLSVEQEARQVASKAGEGLQDGKAITVSTATAWQRRAAKAFATQWRRSGSGMEVQAVELGITGGYLNVNALLALKKRLQAEKPDLLFAALDAVQARQLREAIGADIPMAGTSQLNPLTMQDWIIAERRPELNGVRLVDLPWQLQVDNPAVMAFPRLAETPDQRRSADLERLYALGIDAFRVAREIAMNHTRFELDGVTGKLKVEFGAGPARFERECSPAVYRDGAVVPAEEGQ
jgi:uncharacterized protein